MRTRYVPETGDVVVGRVSEINGKRWRIDVNAGLSASLALSAVDLPGGAQRRRTEVDELNMRTLFEEADLVSVRPQTLPPGRVPKP